MKKFSIDRLLWALLWLLPFFGFFVSYYRAGAPDVTLLSYVDEHFSFAFIKDIFDSIWQKVFSCNLALSGYLSYLVCVEVAHCLFDAVVFIPRFAHAIVERSEKWCSKDS